jgi:transcription termination factor NusB
MVYYIKNGKKNKRPLIHLNKIGLDNRYENIIEDVCDKNIKKNLNKKSRTIKLKSIDTSKIPSFVWYLKKDDSHGERFQVKLGNIKFKCSSSNYLSLNYKLEETKKFLREYKEKNPIEFKKNSMNSDLNENGLLLKKQFYDILKKVNLNYEYTINSNTDILLKEDLSKLTKLEKNLLKDFSIESNESTNDRLKKLKIILK